MKINNMLKKLYILLIVAVVILVAADDCAAQFSKMTIKDYGIKSIVPESFSSVRGAVWVEVVNPTETFTVSDISGKVYKEGSPMIQGTAPAFTVAKGNLRLRFPGRPHCVRVLRYGLCSECFSLILTTILLTYP